MLLKLFGSALVFGACSFIGYILAQDYIQRPQQLRVIQSLLQMLENEISYMSSILSEAFEKIYKSSDNIATIFFEEAIAKLQEDSSLDAAAAWEISVKENVGKTALNKEDEEILISFGKMLGNTNIEGQIKNIRLTLTQLKLQEQKAEEARTKNEGLYKKLGILGGAALVIILL